MRRKSLKHPKNEPISLKGLDFETAIRAAMQTGKPPKPTKRAKKRKAKK